MRAALVVALVVACACSGRSNPNDDGGPEPPGGANCLAFGDHSGEATYYDADGSGNCSFDPIPRDFLVAALNTADYDDAAACGACARVTGPNGDVVVRIVDRCPGCSQGGIDLSQTAFGRIAPLAAGRIDVMWSFVPCDVTGGIALRFKDGSNAFWTAVQVRNHRHAVASVAGGSATRELADIERVTYNYFVASSGLGDGPYRFRITDVHGHAVTVSSVTPGDAVERETEQQFPACRQ